MSDIHDNLTAFQAVLADFAKVVDGVYGNTDEAITRAGTLDEFARQSTAPPSLWDAVREMTAFTREALGEERIAWLGTLPPVIVHAPVALVHASPASAWRWPPAGASDAELAATYSPLRQAIAVYGHIHQPFVRDVGEFTVINTGSAGQSFDCDPRASYLLIDNGTPTVRGGANAISNGKSVRSPRAGSLTRIGWRARSVRRVRRCRNSIPSGLIGPRPPEESGTI